MTQYNWNIAESCVKHHKPSQNVTRPELLNKLWTLVMLYVYDILMLFKITYVKDC